jgi:hypothetical protein
VDLIARRFRGVLIAIVVLGLSAGAVFAGHVVLQAAATAPTASEQGDQNEDADATDNEAPDGTEDGSGNTADNHGALVSMAAQMDTPVVAVGDQFKNHGEFVSCVAHMKTLPAGVTDATVFLSTLTPALCAELAAADEATTADATGTETDNHGALVSAAAQMETPVFTAAGATQFANHGAFVSCVAKIKSMPVGFTGTTADFLATVTPETCAAAAAADKAAKADRVHGKAGQHGRGHKRS